ncbi:MAG: hypothetical protein ACREKE_00740, partial [bacterium]
NLNLTGTYYYDDAEQYGNNIEHFDLDDFVASYSASDSLSFAGEFLNEVQPQISNHNIRYSQTSGYSLYATYSPIANLSISPRYTRIFNNNSTDTHQDFDDQDGFYPGNDSAAAFDDYTLTAKYQMGPLTHILEYQADAASEYEYFTGTNQTPTQIQQTLTYAAVYAF